MPIIKNVIFDIGRVLLEYKPADYLNSLYDAEKVRGLTELVYKGPEWSDVDRGLIGFEDLYGIFSGKRPDWADDLRYLISRECLLSILTPKYDTVDFLYELKTAGYKTYLLSNFSKTGFRWVEEAYPFLRDVDGGVISANVNIIKPDPEIYKLLLKNYSLAPAESVFIDDLPANVQAAGELGIHAIQFTDLENCKKQFEQITQSL